ncbi:MAG: O-antigen ligase family protein [Pseudomonadota bacterium]
MPASSGAVGFAATHLVPRLATIAAIIACLLLVPRPSQVIAVIIAASLGVHIWHRGAGHRLLRETQTVVAAAVPVLGFYVVACIITLITAFAPAEHALRSLEMFAAHAVVLTFFILGRAVGRVEWMVVHNWTFGVVVAATALLVVDQNAFFIRGLVTPDDARVVPSDPNRAFLICSFALAFFLALWTQLGAWRRAGLTIALLAAMFVVSASESARLVALIALVFAVLRPAGARWMLGTAVVAALALMVVGPFVWGPITAAWEAGPLADFKRYTFLARLQTWSDFSTLIRESWFLGRGLDVSKLIAAQPEFFRMPTVPCGAGLKFCPWHPHNVGVQVVTDLGALGIVWFTAMLALVARWVSRRFKGPERVALAAMLVSFLAVSFVADGMWQWWWWLTAGLIAAWLGLASAQRDGPEENAEQAAAEQ